MADARPPVEEGGQSGEQVVAEEPGLQQRADTPNPVTAPPATAQPEQAAAGPAEETKPQLGLSVPERGLVDQMPDKELVQAILQPTQRPSEPVTAGAEVGAGPSFVRQPAEDDATFISRVVDTLSNSPGKTTEVNAYIDRLRRGL